MKKVFVLIIALAVLLIVINVASCQDDSSDNAGEVNAEYLRIHIRANSNSKIDQDVKYKVKTAVVDALTPKLCGVSTKSEAMEIIKKNLSLIDDVSESVLEKEGFYYGAKSRLCEEEFPSRTYGELTLESGLYDALIVDLGSGEGDNCWCVVFPPLCFVADGEGEKVTYKSLIVEWFEKLFG